MTPSKPTPAAERRRQNQRPEGPPWRQQMYDVIFEADTPAGYGFDIGLLVAIITSIVLFSLETVEGYEDAVWIKNGEWFLTILFSIEYVLRLICSRHSFRYALSFWGIIDLFSVLPSYLAFFIGDSSRSLMILRSVRLLRVFRVMKLWRMMNEADELSTAIWRARNKIVVFLTVVLVAVTISGSLMYHVETLMTNVDEQKKNDTESDFTSIPQAMYWATVTMTTVGYGDVVPKTVIGKMISAALILLGYSLIIVPTGFVSAEILGGKAVGKEPDFMCDVCEATGHPVDAHYCYRCGARMHHA
ncbi:Cyclic nucleotide-gated potassium channel [Planctomycetes bacterium CA13]|uniref:Cyclic nucleotide-gated potassium channel n=1 Tax=Novipirellula herctigrandis TaxID=2527986 RepID=A0A5C5YXV7_9BACT|nr:Cyclic nucleotide-gated potassium channel [Planctomycetes bacterium CA13]